MQLLTDLEKKILGLALMGYAMRAGPSQWPTLMPILEKVDAMKEFGEYCKDWINESKGGPAGNPDTIDWSIEKQVQEAYRRFQNISKPEEDEGPGDLVGTLKQPFGLNGYKTAEVGTIVYEKKDRYIIYLHSEKYQETTAVPFYKETLKPNINFYIA